MSDILSPGDQAKLRTLWNAVLTTQSDQHTQAFLGGRNYRLNVAAAFKAIWHTAKVVFEVNKAIVTGTLMPWDVIGIAEGTYSALSNGLNALSESMRPLEYVACVVLSSADQGVTPEEFEARLREFLPRALEGKENLPWYLGLTTKLLTEAQKDLEGVDLFEDLIQSLRDGDWLKEADGKLKVKPRNIVWGFDLTK